MIVAPKPVLNLSGSIVAPGGGPGTDLKFWALADDVSGNDKSVPGSAAKPDGSFLVPAVFPGRHVLHARATVGVTGGIRASSPTHWARLEVDARDMNLTSLVMTLEPMLTISGRVRVDAGGAGDQIGSIGISLMDADQTVFFEVPGAKTLPDGTFTLTGVAPARYRLLASGASDLTIKGITAGSALDLADALIDLRAGAAPPSLDVVLTRQTTELTGSLRDAASRPVSNYTIVAFAPDRRYWTGHTRRVQATRAATDGSFRFSNLPAGEYLMAAVTDVEDGQWLDPSWLAELVPHGVRVVVPDGGKVVQNLQVR